MQILHKDGNSTNSNGDLLGYAVNATTIFITSLGNEATAPSLVVLDNSITDPTLITEVGRYIVQVQGIW